MLQRFRVAGTVVLVVVVFCVAGFVAQNKVAAQVKVVDGTGPPTATAPPPTPANADPTNLQPDADATVSAAGEPIVVKVRQILVPAMVMDRDGNIMNSLQPSQFHVYDNNLEQDIQVDTDYQPISLVICIEASTRDDGVLKQIHKIGSMIEPLVIGDAGEAAVIAFDHRIRTMQDFTNDPEKIKAAINKISSGSSQSRMVDAIDSAIFMLRHRGNIEHPRRRVILLVSETRDQGSMARGRQTLIAMQLSNVTLYSADISQVTRRFAEQVEPPRPDAIAPEARNLPMGQNTPLAVQQSTGWGNSVEFMPLLKEIYTDSKSVFIKDPVKLFTRGTGGEQFVWVKGSGLEDAIAKIGTEIHSQYLISYAPKKETLLEGGYHDLKVTVDYPRAKVVTRPGYWLAGVNQ